MIVCAALVVPPDSNVYVPQELAHRKVGLDYGNGTAYAGLQMLSRESRDIRSTTEGTLTSPVTNQGRLQERGEATMFQG